MMDTLSLRMLVKNVTVVWAAINTETKRHQEAMKPLLYDLNMAFDAAWDAKLEEEQPKIEVEYLNPPIPIRDYDWHAWRDGQEEGKFHGWGSSSVNAVDDLLARERGER